MSDDSELTRVLEKNRDLEKRVCDLEDTNKELLINNDMLKTKLREFKIKLLEHKSKCSLSKLEEKSQKFSQNLTSLQTVKQTIEPTKSDQNSENSPKNSFEGRSPGDVKSKINFKIEVIDISSDEDQDLEASLQNDENLESPQIDENVQQDSASSSSTVPHLALIEENPQNDSPNSYGKSDGQNKIISVIDEKLKAKIAKEFKKFILHDSIRSTKFPVVQLGDRCSRTNIISVENSTVQESSSSKMGNEEIHNKSVDNGESERKGRTRQIISNFPQENVEATLELEPKKSPIVPNRNIRRMMSKYGGKSQDAKTRTCKFCSKTFSLSIGLKVHLRKYHTGKRTCYSCEICPKSYTQPHNLKLHQLVHHKAETEDKGYTNSAQLENHKVSRKRYENSEREPTKCKICSRSFANPRNLKIHLSQLHSGRYHTCTVCPKKFRTLEHLNIHAKAHEGIKSYKCNLCSKTFWQKPNLEFHIRTHTGEKPYNCSYCYKAFAQKTNLNNHHRLHTGEKPYSCHLCSRKFPQKSNLEYHVRTHY